jgi:hypothetical protein
MVLGCSENSGSQWFGSEEESLWNGKDKGDFMQARMFLGYLKLISRAL